MTSVMYFWFDGRLVPAGEAAIPASDWGFLYGDALFETIRVAHGVPLAWGRHFRRLEKGMRALRYPSLPYDGDGLHAALRATLAANGLADASARLTVTRGRSAAGLDPRACSSPTVLIACRPYDGPPAEHLHRGIRLRTARVPARTGWTHHRVKSANYLDSILALDVSLRSGDDEPVFVDRDGRVLEGARSNIFIARSGRLVTPPVRLGILPGIAREVVIEWARRDRVPIDCRPFGIAALRGADEIFVTNSLWGALPVATVDGRTIGDGAPGPLARRMIDRWARWMAAAR